MTWGAYRQADPRVPLSREAYAALDVMPLQDLSEASQADINALAGADRTPPREVHLVGCAMPSRAFFEWHVRRGRNPSGERRTKTSRFRELVIKRDGMVCQLCKLPIATVRELHIDHIKPHSLGGETVLGNLRAAHALCNMRRGNRCEASR